MKRRYYHIITIIAIAAIIGIYVVYVRTVQTAYTPPLLYSYSLSSPTTGQISTLEYNEYVNVTQGSTQQVNVTFTSLASVQIEIPIENLTITSFTDSLGYSFWASEAQPNTINYSFSQSQIDLQPHTSDSTILTIKWSNSAPTGTFTLNIFLGNLKFVSNPPKFDVPYSSSIWLGVSVNPKEP